MPVAGGDGAGVAAAEGGYGGVILLRAVNVVGEVVVDGDAIELGGGLIVFGAPAFAAVEADLCAAVGGFDEAIGILGGDPHVVIVTVLVTNSGEGFAAVGGFEEGGVDGVDGVLVFGIGEDLGVVPGALLDGVVAVLLRPGFSGVVGAVNAALLSFDERPDALWVGG